MENMKPLAASDITEPGAYEWIDAKGVVHIGFIRRESRGRLTGSFVSVDGDSRATAILYQICAESTVLQGGDG